MWGSVYCKRLNPLSVRISDPLLKKQEITKEEIQSPVKVFSTDSTGKV